MPLSDSGYLPDAVADTNVDGKAALVEAYETMARPLPLASMNEVLYTTVDQLLTVTNNHFIASAQRQPRA